MLWSWYAIGAALAVAAACSFFFALAESALFALGRFRAQAMLAFGNTLANATVIGMVVWVLARSDYSELLAGVMTLVFLLMGCEVVPKALGVRAPEFWSLRVARILTVLLALTRPFRRVAQA